MISSQKTRLYLVMGPQGSGKSTQAEKIAEHFNAPYFQAGSRLREVAEESSPIANEIRQFQQSGELVPAKVIDQIFRDFITEHASSTVLVIDGFPRNEDQYQYLNQLAKKHNWELVGVFVDISDETAVERLKLRARTETDRDDDTAELIKKRLAEYRLQTLPIVERLEDDYKVHKVDGEPPIDKVTEQIFNQLEIS